jgi:hypothetical protein
MKKFVCLLALCIYLFSCKNQPAATTNNNAADSTQADTSFFPVTDYIGGQIKMIDSLKPPLTKTTTINNKTENTSVTDNELHALAKNFLSPNISDPSIKHFYKQTNIADQSIPSVTLIYTTADTSLPIQKINVFIKPSPVLNDKVSSLFIEKAFTQNDTFFNQKLYWKSDKNFQITTEKTFKGKTLPAEQVKIIWDPTE